MNDIIKIVQALEDSNVLLKGVTKTIENETAEQKGGFLSMLLGTLGVSLLGNVLTGKGIVRAGSGNNKGKGIVRAGSGCSSSSALQNNKGKGIVRAGSGCPSSSALQNNKGKGIVRAGSGRPLSSALQKQLGL